MFVKALRVAGFKSFADPTVLEFERAINVIVGPNGSGKSNIADALLWVLGSQAPSSLRGASMEDVIFAGSAARPRLGSAEVELTLDNSSRSLPLDLSEVAISRFTDRSGVSEYRINGTPCRLLDIAELLSDTGIGRTLHTVVSQGQLEQVLQARPDERRAFIEEAAQIGKFRRRKDRALQKMTRVDDNLMRLNDVLSELRRALRPLKRQASAATAHSELLAEAVALKQRLAATEVQRLASEERRLNVDEERHRASLLADELATLRARLVTSGRERAVLASSLEAAYETQHRMARAADRLGGLARVARERAALIAARLAAETEDRYRERIELLEADVERWQRESSTLRAASASAVDRAEEIECAANAAATARDVAEAELAKAREAETAAAQALVRAEGSDAAGRATVASVQARIQAVIERRRISERELSVDSRAIDAATIEVRAIEGELTTATEAAAAAETRLEDARRRADGLREALSERRAQAAAAAARVDAFEEVKQLLSQHPAVGRLTELIVDARRRAVLTATAETESAARMQEADQEVELCWHDVARKDEELRRLDALMSGATERLAGARRRYESKEIEIAARDDELARAHETLAESQKRAAEQRATLPVRSAALRDATADREEAEAVLRDTRRRADEVAHAAAAARMDATAAEERALGAERQLEEVRRGRAQAVKALEGLERRRSSLAAARVRAESLGQAALLASNYAESWLERAERRAAAIREQVTASDDLTSSWRRRERQLEAKLEEASRRTSELDVRRAEVHTRRIAVSERAIDDWGLSEDDLLNVEPLDRGGEQGALARVDALEKQMRRLGPVNPEAARAYEEMSERESFLVGQMDDLRSSKRDLVRIVQEVDETIVKLFTESFHDVAREFEQVFGRLFPGGTGRLKLTDQSDLLQSGIEIEARPPGKNVKKMSLLSGGERSLVALAFLFAIFRARPSPFYLLDEVEAALDDINLTRFLSLVRDLEQSAQVLIVTHQKRTMEVAGVLYGVTMGRDGVSRVVAKKMDDMPDDEPASRITV